MRELRIPKSILSEVRYIVCAEIEPSENTKKQFPEIFEIEPNFKWKILYYPRLGKWKCTCLGYLSASRVERICHHLWEFLKKNKFLEEEILEMIKPQKMKKEEKKIKMKEGRNLEQK